jgi:DNA-binding transcriptional MocR family regulator
VTARGPELADRHQHFPRTEPEAAGHAAANDGVGRSDAPALRAVLGEGLVRPACIDQHIPRPPNTPPAAINVREAIQRGELAPNSRLPAERALAEALAVSRSTIAAAYDQLANSGMVERRQGSGTYISAAAAPRQPAADALAAALDANSMFRGLIAGPNETIDFSMAAPLPAPGVLEVLRRVPELMPPAKELDRGYRPAGLPARRHAIAAHLTSMGVPTSERQVLVTNGGQQAINLAAQLWLSPGDAVVTENPTYHGALDAFRAARGRLLSVPVDEEGVRTDRLHDLLSRTSPRLVYLSPTFNNPTGALLAAAA